jgi:CheY-like chemotaxis protein
LKIVRTQNAMATILLVEDDPGDQVLTRRAMDGSDLDIDLRIVSDGEQALDYLHRRGGFEDPQDAPRPDLILLDLNLPKLDGRQVLEHIRGQRELRCIPVVVVTTSDRPDDVDALYELGVNSYITKPADMGRFAESLCELGRYWFSVVKLPSTRV